MRAITGERSDACDDKIDVMIQTVLIMLQLTLLQET
jgi:hypothetical protein